MGKRIIVLVFVTLFILSASSCTSVGADGVSSPSNVNQLITDFSDLDLKPGVDGKFDFVLYNPYDITMKNISLVIEIYSFNNFEGDEEIAEIKNSIYFERDNDMKVTISRSELRSDESETVSLDVKNGESTEEGVYSIRFKLSFDLNGHEEIVMKSIGHFTDEEVDEASKSGGENDKEYFVSGYNISELNVDGILKESSISVRDPVPRWPQYMLAAVTIGFSALAVYSYLREKES